MKGGLAAEELELAKDIGKYSLNPSGFMKYAFPWGTDILPAIGPRSWQTDINDSIGRHLSNPATRFHPFQVAVASGHGIGKSAEIGMLLVWAMSTCEDCKIIVTAGTGTQLSTKTAPEVQKWFRLAINSHWWDINATSIRVRDPLHQANWRTDFITWSVQKPEAFAGMHNIGRRIVIVMDESSSVDDIIWEVIEGALTDEQTEIILIVFGNPTRNTGRFKECFGKSKHRWVTKQIDSRTVEGTNKEQIQKWIDDYGEDSDFVRIRVRGEFPRAGSSQFIPNDAVESCRKYVAEGFAALPKILSVDVARFGDDQTVVGCRQGRKLNILARYRGLDTVQVAERVIEFIESEKPDATVVDGDGIGGGVIDQLKHRNHGRNLHEFHGGEKPNDSNVYFNRRAEVWGLMRDWLKAGAQIPDDPELESDLTGPQYYFSPKNQIQIERKQDMKARGLASPDLADMLAMSFSVKVAPKPKVITHSAYQGAGSWMG